MRAAGGPVACLVVALPVVAVGAATAAGITATVLPPPAGSIIRVDLDGVLGQDFLSRFDFTIDYRRSRIAWHDAGYVAPGIRLALVPAQDRWLVELPQPATSGAAATVRRFVPDSGADTLVLFGEARARCLIAEWRAGAAALGSLTGARAVRIADGRRPARRQREARSARSRRSCRRRRPTILTACCRCTCSRACSSARGAARWWFSRGDGRQPHATTAGPWSRSARTPRAGRPDPTAGSARRSAAR